MPDTRTSCELLIGASNRRPDQYNAGPRQVRLQNFTKSDLNNDSITLRIKGGMDNWGSSQLFPFRAG